MSTFRTGTNPGTVPNAGMGMSQYTLTFKSSMLQKAHAKLKWSAGIFRMDKRAVFQSNSFYLNRSNLFPVLD